MDTLVINPGLVQAVQDTVLNYGETAPRAASVGWLSPVLLACALIFFVIVLMAYVDWRCRQNAEDYTERLWKEISRESMNRVRADVFLVDMISTRTPEYGQKVKPKKPKAMK